MAAHDATLLVVEDGDEYLHGLTSFVPGPRYLQAHSGTEALELLRHERIDLVYLDMRFDRIDLDQLIGDLARVSEQHNGDRVRAIKHLQDHQGLYILDFLDQHGFGTWPIVLAYDFSREPRRFERLVSRYPKLTWVPDSITPEEIVARMARLGVPLKTPGHS